MKADICVSIVSGHGLRPRALVEACTYWIAAVDPTVVADDADGIFGPREDPDQSICSSALPAEGNADA
jgi:hypothetical protein